MLRLTLEIIDCLAAISLEAKDHWYQDIMLVALEALLEELQANCYGLQE